MKIKIRKGDQIEVISGRSDDKGKRGEVIKVQPEDEYCCCAGHQHPHQAPTTGPISGSHS